MSRLCVLMLDKDPVFLDRLSYTFSEISDSVQNISFIDEEQFLDRLYLDNKEIDAVIIPADSDMIDGISLAAAISGRFKDIEIIFSVSPCPGKALERLFLRSVQLRPFAVIVKPVEKEVAESIVKRLWESRNNKRNIITLSSGRRKILCRSSEIIMVRSQKRRILFTTENGEVCVYGQIQKIRSMLPDYFLNPHASYLVNARCIKSVESDFAVLRDGTKVPISRGRRHDFIEDIKRITSWGGGGGGTFIKKRCPARSGK